MTQRRRIPPPAREFAGDTRRLMLAAALVAALAGTADGVPTIPPSEVPTVEGGAALDYLLRVGELQRGVTVLTYERDANGRYYPSYASSVCPIRGRSRAEALRAAGRKDVGDEAARLAQLADVDGSRTVSTAEASHLASVIDFGYRVAAARAVVPEAKVSELMGLPTQDQHALLLEYQGFVQRGRAVGVVFPTPSRLP